MTYGSVGLTTNVAIDHTMRIAPGVLQTRQAIVPIYQLCLQQMRTVVNEKFSFLTGAYTCQRYNYTRIYILTCTYIVTRPYRRYDMQQNADY